MTIITQLEMNMTSGHLVKPVVTDAIEIAAAKRTNVLFVFILLSNPWENSHIYLHLKRNNMLIISFLVIYGSCKGSIFLDNYHGAHCRFMAHVCFAALE